MLAKPAAGNCFVRNYLFDFELFVFTLEIAERENGVCVCVWVQVPLADVSQYGHW